MATIKYSISNNTPKAKCLGVTVAICQDLGIVYDISNPDNVIASWDTKQGGWVIAKTPQYYPSGWGNPAKGDKTGYALHRAASELLSTIGATVVEINREIKDVDLEYAKFRKCERSLRKLEALGLGIDHNDVFSSKVVSGNGQGTNILRTISDLKAVATSFINKKSFEAKDYKATSKVISYKDKTIAIRVADKIVVNTEAMTATGIEKSFLGGQSVVQRELRKVGVSIPFNVLVAADLELTDTEIVDQGPEETIPVGDTNRHFTGAMLLRNKGRLFLMDLDREEIKHGIWNPFFVEVLSGTTIQEAYESMKPVEIKEAEQKGDKVIRQGEFFFIETPHTIEADRAIYQPRNEVEAAKLQENTIVRSQLSHGKGRPNNCLMVFNGPHKGLVCGVVTHTGREHRPVNLGMTNQRGPIGTSPWDNYGDKRTYNLWRCVPNTTVGNFTIQGDID
jgi:hypothetical protein